MQELFGSVRRSLVFRPSSSPSSSPTTDTDTDVGFGGFVDKLGSSIRKSRIGIFAAKSPLKALPFPPAKENMPPIKDEAPPIRWRKGGLIGSGAFGRVYMGMNIDTGELLAVKQVNWNLLGFIVFEFFWICAGNWGFDCVIWFTFCRFRLLQVVRLGRKLRSVIKGVVINLKFIDWFLLLI